MINTLQTEIISILLSKIPELATCTTTPEEHFSGVPQRFQFKRPAALIAMTKAERQNPDGTDRLCLESHWSCLMIANHGNQKHRNTEARDLAIAATMVIEGNEFGVDFVLPAKVQGLSLETMDAELSKIVSAWQVEWSQVVYLDNIKDSYSKQQESMLL